MQRLYRKFFILFFSCLVLCHCGHREQNTSNNLIEIPGFTMGTTYMVKIVKNSGAVPTITPGTTQMLSTGISQCLDTVNQQMSMWREDSEISRFNRYRETGWFEISSDTANVIAEALTTSEKSGGAFDITVGPLVNLWGFGPAKSKEKREIPGEAQIKEALAKTGYRNLSVRLNPPAIQKTGPWIYCDLSAIAKGFGVDKVAEYIEEKGFANYLVEIGGEVRARGINAQGMPWRVAIASPDGTSNYQKVLFLKNASMATSGDYHNYFEQEGVRYSHTIDPNTGRPITHKLASVTVVHASCMTADAMATAIDVLGPEKGYRLALKENLPVFLVIREKDGFIEKMTPQFQALLNTPQ